MHRATLPNDAQVVVKVQRPNAARQIESDLKLMASAARVARERVRQLDFIDTGELVDEFGRSIRLELDYQQEARNAETFRRNFAGDERIAVPRVWWRYTTGRLLTLDRLEGTHVRDLDLAAWDDDARRELAYTLTDAWMAMIFRHAFFHGDPHPSNILHLDDGRLGLIDFGLAGRLTDLDMARLTRLFVDAATENVEALPRRLTDLGVRYPREREEELRSRLEELYYRYYGSRLSDIDPIEAIREGLTLIYAMNLRLPTRFVILDKAIATLGSVAAEVYPDFNVFEVARPYAKQLIAERYSPRRVALRARAEVQDIAELALEVPRQVHDILERAPRRRARGEDLEPRDRRPRAPHGRLGQPDRRRARDPRRPRRLVADRRPGEGRAAPPGAAPPVGRRLRALRRVRRLAALGRLPLRKALTSGDCS